MKCVCLDQWREGQYIDKRCRGHTFAMWNIISVQQVEYGSKKIALRYDSRDILEFGIFFSMFDPKLAFGDVRMKNLAYLSWQIFFKFIF